MENKRFNYNSYIKFKIISLAFMALVLTGCGKEGDVESITSTLAPMEDHMAQFEATLLAGQSADTRIMTEEFLTEAYGITSDMYLEIQGRVPSDEQWCDEYIFVQAKPEQSDAIVDAIKARVKYLTSGEVDLSEEHLAQVEAYELFVRGDYIAFSFGLSGELAIEYFKAAFIEE